MAMQSERENCGSFSGKKENVLGTSCARNMQIKMEIAKIIIVYNNKKWLECVKLVVKYGSNPQLNIH